MSCKLFLNTDQSTDYALFDSSCESDILFIDQPEVQEISGCSYAIEPGCCECQRLKPVSVRAVDLVHSVVQHIENIQGRDWVSLT